MKNVRKVLTVACLCATLFSCSSGNLDYVKAHADDVWEGVGFKIVGYEGYSWGWGGFNNYGGASVWYRLEKIPDNGVSYTGYLVRWGEEIHVYGPTATDAIKGLR